MSNEIIAKSINAQSAVVCPGCQEPSFPEGKFVRLSAAFPEVKIKKLFGIINITFQPSASADVCLNCGRKQIGIKLY